MVSVVLDADVDGLGAKGELVEVKPAYAENFIVSKGLGSIASKELMAQMAKEAEEAAAKAAAAKKHATEGRDTLQQKFGKTGIKTEVQVGADSKITDTFTSEDVAEALSRAGVKVDASSIQLPEVTEVGSFVAEVTLHPDVTMSIKVAVEKSKITFV